MAYLKKEWRMLFTIDVEKTHSGKYGAPGCKRQKKKKATPEDIERQNEWAAIKRLARKINANFIADDLHVVLTYRKEDRPNTEEAKKILKDFVDCLRKEYKKKKLPMKYVITTEYLNKAIHHHIIINNGIEHGVNTMSLIRELWAYGRPKYVPLDDSGDYKLLASYFIKETSKTFRDKNSHQGTRYSCSRNLIIPEPEVEVIEANTFSKTPKPYKGYYIDKNSIVEGINPVTGYRYQHYTMIKINKKRGG